MISEFLQASCQRWLIKKEEQSKREYVPLLYGLEGRDAQEQKVLLLIIHPLAAISRHQDQFQLTLLKALEKLGRHFSTFSLNTLTSHPFIQMRKKSSRTIEFLGNSFLSSPDVQNFLSPSQL